MSLAYYARNAAGAERARRRMIREGCNMNGDKLWSIDEDRILSKLYPDVPAIQKHLPHRTRQSIWARCNRLGMKQQRHQWTALEVSKLKRLYPGASRAAICAEFPFASWVAIMRIARYHGARRNRRSYLRTGKRQMDDILARIEEIGWRLRDLDEESRTGRYFRNQCWRRHKLNFTALAKAVSALDGELAISWRKYA